MPGEGSRCSVCNHYQVDAINEALRGGMGLGTAAKKFKLGVSRSTVKRHRTACLGIAPETTITDDGTPERYGVPEPDARVDELDQVPTGTAAITLKRVLRHTSAVASWTLDSGSGCGSVSPAECELMVAAGPVVEARARVREAMATAELPEGLRRELFLAAVACGHYPKVAAELSGLDYGSVKRWLEHGERKPDSPWTAFFMAYRILSREAEDCAVKAVQNAIRREDADMRTAQWYVARRSPARWGAQRESPLKEIANSPTFLAVMSLFFRELAEATGELVPDVAEQIQQRLLAKVRAHLDGGQDARPPLQ